MKEITHLFTILIVLTFSSCKEETKSTHADSHALRIDYAVSNSVNIGSFNIYMNDNIVGQMPASGTHTDTKKHSFELEQGITQHPMSLNITIEPMFLDTSEARGDVRMSIIVDDSKVAETPLQNLKYGESVSLSHTVE